MRPLFPAFDKFVNDIVAEFFPCGFDVTDDGSLCDTFEKLEAYYTETGRIRVWSGGSEETIFGSPETNHAFRAWHDLCHLLLGEPFTPEGESEVAELQKQMVISRGGPSLFLRILDIEINGQIRYYEEHGSFPVNQRQFMLDSLPRDCC